MLALWIVRTIYCGCTARSHATTYPPTGYGNGAAFFWMESKKLQHPRNRLYATNGLTIPVGQLCIWSTIGNEPSHFVPLKYPGFCFYYTSNLIILLKGKFLENNTASCRLVASECFLYLILHNLSKKAGQLNITGLFWNANRSDKKGPRLTAEGNQCHDRSLHNSMN